MRILTKKEAELIKELKINGISVTEIVEEAIKSLIQEESEDEYKKYVLEKTKEALKNTYR